MKVGATPRKDTGSWMNIIRLRDSRPLEGVAPKNQGETFWQAVFALRRLKGRRLRCAKKGEDGREEQVIAGLQDVLWLPMSGIHLTPVNHFGKGRDKWKGGGKERRKGKKERLWIGQRRRKKKGEAIRTGVARK